MLLGLEWQCHVIQVASPLSVLLGLFELRIWFFRCFFGELEAQSLYAHKLVAPWGKWGSLTSNLLTEDMVLDHLGCYYPTKYPSLARSLPFHSASTYKLQGQNNDLIVRTRRQKGFLQLQCYTKSTISYSQEQKGHQTLIV